MSALMNSSEWSLYSVAIYMKQVER